jgi:hypothetical protein
MQAIAFRPTGLAAMQQIDSFQGNRKIQFSPVWSAKWITFMKSGRTLTRTTANFNNENESAPTSTAIMIGAPNEQKSRLP